MKPRTSLWSGVMAAVLGWALGCTGRHAGAPNEADGVTPSGSAGTAGSPRNSRTMPDVPIDPALLPGAPEAIPLLERASTADVACTVVQPLELLGVEEAAPVQLAGNTWLAQATSLNAEPTGVFLSPVSALGTLGEARHVYDVSARVPRLRATRELQAVAGNERMTLLWTHERDEPRAPEGTLTELLAMQLGAQGEPLAEPLALSSPSLDAVGVHVVPAAGGLAALWTETDIDDQRFLVRFARLDANGELIGAKETLWEQQRSLLTSSLTALGDDFLVTYWSDAYDADESGYFNVVLQADGQKKGARAHPGTFAPATQLVRGERLLAAWTVEHELPPSATATAAGARTSEATTVRLGWFDRDGKSVGASYELQAPVADQLNMAPVLVDLGAEVGLSWSRGSITYVCAGCVPDNQLQLVVLDGTSLIPKSTILGVPNTRSGGGLLPSQIQRMGDSALFAVARVLYHAGSDLASVTLSCTR